MPSHKTGPVPEGLPGSQHQGRAFGPGRPEHFTTGRPPAGPFKTEPSGEHERPWGFPGGLGQLALTPAPAPLPDAVVLSGFLTQAPDPQGVRGRRYLLSALVAAVAAGVLAGARSLTAISEWITDAPLWATTPDQQQGARPSTGTTTPTSPSGSRPCPRQGSPAWPTALARRPRTRNSGVTRGRTS